MSRSSLVQILVGLLAGAVMPFQAGINAKLRQSLGSPLQAALVSFFVGTVALAAVVVMAPAPWPRSGLDRAPWWAWTGGFLGAFFISASVVLSPRLGALALVALVVTGQLAAALALDHFGLLAFPKVPISSGRVVGAALLVVGLLLILQRAK